MPEIQTDRKEVKVKYQNFLKEMLRAFMNASEEQQELMIKAIAFVIAQKTAAENKNDND